MRSLRHTCRNGVPSRKRYNLASIFQNNSISLLISSLTAHPMIHSIRANIALNRVERPFHEPSVIKSTVDRIYVCLGEYFTTFTCDFQKFHIVLLLFYISFPRVAAIFQDLDISANPQGVPNIHLIWSTVGTSSILNLISDIPASARFNVKMCAKTVRTATTKSTFITDFLALTYNLACFYVQNVIVHERECHIVDNTIGEFDRLQGF